MSDGLTFRQGEERDLPFVEDAFVSSYRTAHAAGLVPMPYWEEQARRNWRWVLARPGVEVIVACHPTEGQESRTDIYGFIVLERDVWIPTRLRRDGQWVEELAPAGCPVVHFVYCKAAYRRHGIGRLLFKAARVDLSGRFIASCKTGLSSQLEKKCAPFVVFNPLPARYAKRASEARPLEEEDHEAHSR